MRVGSRTDRGRRRPASPARREFPHDHTSFPAIASRSPSPRCIQASSHSLMSSRSAPQVNSAAAVPSANSGATLSRSARTRRPLLHQFISRRAGGNTSVTVFNNSAARNATTVNPYQRRAFLSECAASSCGRAREIAPGGGEEEQSRQYVSPLRDPGHRLGLRGVERKRRRGEPRTADTEAPKYSPEDDTVQGVQQDVDCVIPAGL